MLLNSAKSERSNVKTFWWSTQIVIFGFCKSVVKQHYGNQIVIGIGCRLTSVSLQLTGDIPEIKTYMNADTYH